MRLIDADNLRKDIENLCPEFGNEDSSFVEQGEVLDFIEEQPTVDAVEVVRCRDCIMSYIDDSGLRMPDYDCPMYPGVNCVDDDDFCSMGKRRGG